MGAFKVQILRFFQFRRECRPIAGSLPATRTKTLLSAGHPPSPGSPFLSSLQDLSLPGAPGSIPSVVYHFVSRVIWRSLSQQVLLSLSKQASLCLGTRRPSTDGPAVSCKPSAGGRCGPVERGLGTASQDCGPVLLPEGCVPGDLVVRPWAHQRSPLCSEGLHLKFSNKHGIFKSRGKWKENKNTAAAPKKEVGNVI